MMGSLSGVCPYCGKDVGLAIMGHMAVCPKNPANEPKKKDK